MITDLFGGKRAARRRAKRAEAKSASAGKPNRTMHRSFGAPVGLPNGYAPRHVNAGPLGWHRRKHMAEIRAGLSPEPLPHATSPGRRQIILARRAGK